MKKELIEELKENIEQGGTIVRGKAKPSCVFHLENPDVPEIREHLGLSQDQFARLPGVSIATIRNWEQGRKETDGAVRVLLTVAAKYPKIILETVHT